jgi:hypothetical protein
MVAKASLVIFLLLGLSLLLVGTVYSLAGEYMPYHATAMGMQWSELDAGQQWLLVGFLKLGGAGMLTSGLAITVMVASSFRKSVAPYRLLLPLVTVGYLSMMVYATYIVYARTPGDPPLFLPSLALAFSIVGSLMLWSPAARRNDDE